MFGASSISQAKLQEEMGRHNSLAEQAKSYDQLEAGSWDFAATTAGALLDVQKMVLYSPFTLAINEMVQRKPKGPSPLRWPYFRNQDSRHTPDEN